MALTLSRVFSPSHAHAHPEPLQDSSAVYQILSGINTARISNGLTPYALNPLLTQAAQSHSEYQRDTGQITHDGPGGTRALDRVLAVGYPAARANENIYAGMGGPDQAVNWWLGSTAGHVQNILHTVMREVGIGAAPSADGATYYTVVFSAQPNVLPIFVNNDAYTTNSPSVTLALSNEGIFSGGSGQIGRAVQIQISNTPDFANTPFQPWAQNVSWTLDTGAGDGLKTVYVRFVDAAGRTADSQDSIVLDTGGGVVIVPTSVPTAPPSPTVVVAPQPANPVPQPTATPTVGATIVPTSLSTMTAAAWITPPPTRYIGRAGMTSTPVFTVQTRRAGVLGIPVGTLRMVLWGPLGLGLVCIVLGNLALGRSRRSLSAPQGDEDNGDD
jgi:hypothetical protein